MCGGVLNPFRKMNPHTPNRGFLPSIIIPFVLPVFAFAWCINACTHRDGFSVSGFSLAIFRKKGTLVVLAWCNLFGAHH